MDNIGMEQLARKLVQVVNFWTMLQMNVNVQLVWTGMEKNVSLVKLEKFSTLKQTFVSAHLV